MEKSVISGLDTNPPSSSITIGFVTDPSFSDSRRGLGSCKRTFRQVAWRAKQARCGAIDENVDAVDTDETEDERDRRNRSDTIDSGLDTYEVVLAKDGRRDRSGRRSAVNVSRAHRFKEALCAMAIAEQTDGRREPHALAAGVLEATKAGVIWGVGSGPMRARVGIGGTSSGCGSKKRGGTDNGVGVASWDVLSAGVESEWDDTRRDGDAGPQLALCSADTA